MTVRCSAVNDWADRSFDGRVRRTAQRPLAVGEIAPWEALVVAAVLALCAFLLVLSTNRTTILLSLPAFESMLPSRGEVWLSEGGVRPCRSR